MDQFLNVLLPMVFIPTIVVGLGAWVCILVFGFKTIANRKPGVSLWRNAPMGNPANIILAASLLTGAGLKFRRRMFWSVAVFVISILLTLGLAALTGNLR